MKRINPADVPEMYRRLGMTPRTARTGDRGANCGCLLGTLVVDSGEDCREDLIGTSVAIKALASRGFGESYCKGLYKGFDGWEKHMIDTGEICGYKDGRAAREALIAAGMMEDGNV